jgi:hypothetical protein
MPIRIQNYPPFRECRFCLSLQDDSVFADFDLDEEGRAFLRRISFDGYGCCYGEFKKMALDDSRVLVDSVERDAVQDPKIEVVLRTYFEQNADVIWSDALATHELL